MGDYGKGGGFLFDQVSEGEIFTPEDFTEEQRMFAKTAEDFMNAEVLPKVEELEEKKAEGLMPSIMRQAGELGLFSVDVPEEYGGLGMDKVTTCLVAEKTGLEGSFAATYGAHCNIGTLPIIFFGTPEQKEKYLPGSASGEKIHCYALTEAGSGSDALAAKTTAKLSEDGKYYILNGSKQFITNVAWADVAIVFAKVDGDKFTGFIVDMDSPGVSRGPEEKKMGLHASSTCQIILEDAKVPVENVLGRVGKGHVIAFNILNLGRLKLGPSCVGGSKKLIKDAAAYAKERCQFGVPIASFGAIRKKLADMVIRTYAAESIGYRTAGQIDRLIEEVDKSDQEKVIKCIEEFAIEASVSKVFGSEAMDDCCDDAIQILGGYGYTSEYPMERAYRDSRVNRIFEGTNEINRLIIPNNVMKRAAQGRLPLLEAIGAARAAAADPSKLPGKVEGPLADERRALATARLATLYILGEAMDKHQNKLNGEQEILEMLADMLIGLCALDSTLRRAVKSIDKLGAEKAAVQAAIARALTLDVLGQGATLGYRILLALYEGDELQKKIVEHHKLLPAHRANPVALRRTIADKVLDMEGWPV